MVTAASGSIFEDSGPILQSFDRDLRPVWRPKFSFRTCSPHFSVSTGLDLEHNLSGTAESVPRTCSKAERIPQIAGYKRRGGGAPPPGGFNN